MRGLPPFFAKILLVGFLVATQPGLAAAQIPDPGNSLPGNIIPTPLPSLSPTLPALEPLPLPSPTPLPSLQAPQLPANPLPSPSPITVPQLPAPTLSPAPVPVPKLPAPKPSPVLSPAPKLPAPKPAPIDAIDAGGVKLSPSGSSSGSGSGSKTGPIDAIGAVTGYVPIAGSNTGGGTTGGGTTSPSQGPIDAITVIAATQGGSGSNTAIGGSDGATAGGGAAFREGLSYYSSAAVKAGAYGWAKGGGRFLLNWTAILGTSQPSLAILVDAVNDADGDGIFSNAETAPAPGSDVSFKALVTNIGATEFEMASVTHTFTGSGGRVQQKVCGELVGLMLAPGESLACSFPVTGYAPARGESLVNTVMAAAFETGKSRRGTSDSDTSTVDTLFGDEVLAVAIERKPNLLAFTGTEAARLVALAMVLIVSGGGLIQLARIRSRRPTRPPLSFQSSLESLGWWAAGPVKSRPHRKQRTGRR